jgi:hypothetical protein
MKTQSARVLALLAVAAALTLFVFVIATPSLRHVQIGPTAQTRGALPLDDQTGDGDTATDDDDDSAMLQQEEDDAQAQQQWDDEQAQQAEQQAIDDQVEEQQEADEQNAAAQAQMQLDEELASSP